MKRKLFPLLLLAGASSLPVITSAAEPYSEYLSALRSNGYGEMAVLYLEKAKAGKLPEELATTFELEMALSRVISAGEAFNAEQANQRLDQATANFNNFLKTNAQHESAPAAIDGLGSMLADRGAFEINQAKAIKDPAKQKAAYDQARKYLVESRKYQLQTVERAQKHFLDLKEKKKEKEAPKTGAKPGAKKPPVVVKRTIARKPTEEESELKSAEGDWNEARMNLALLDYSEATTYTDATAKARRDLLTVAAKKFDDIYQGHRSDVVGVYSHMWHGRCVDELGDIKQAIDIYEEVLEVAEAAGDGSGLEDLFIQVENSYLLLLKKKGATAEFATQAEEWLRKNQKMKNLPGYQGIALEYTKHQISLTKDLMGKPREDAFRKIVKTLSEIAKVPSESKNEAILLRRQYQGEVKGSESTVEIASFDEGMALAQEAVASAQWPDAIVAYSKSIELADKTKDAEKLRKVKYQLAYAQLMAAKPEDCITTSQELVKENATAQFSPEAGALSVQAALQIYANASRGNDPAKTQAAVKQLNDLADDTMKRWPTRPEADDARIAKGQAAQVIGDIPTALMTFESVNPESARYPIALYYSGQTYWRRYLGDRSKQGADPKALADVRTKAEQALVKSVAGQEKQLKAGEQPPRSLAEAKTILGEMAMEAGKFEPALTYFDPLADAVVKLNPTSLDPLMMRQIFGALRSHLSLGREDNLPKITGIATVLINAQGTDAAFVNSALVDYSKLVDKVLKATRLSLLDDEKAVADLDKKIGDVEKLIEAADKANKKEDKDKQTAEKTKLDEERKKLNDKKVAAENKRTDLEERWTALINNLAGRKQLSLAGSVYVAESLLALGENGKARDQFVRITEREREPGFLPQGPSGPQAMIRVRSQLAGLLRNEGKFDEALKEIDALIAATAKNPALEPLVEKCRLAQAKAEKAETDVAAWTKAIEEWTALRNRLSKLQKKPPQYYDATYSLCDCVLRKYKLTKDKKEVFQTEQLLKATLALAPQLNGPEMVGKYNELIEESVAVRLNKPYTRKSDLLNQATGDAGAAKKEGGGEPDKNAPAAKTPEPAKTAPPAANAAKPAAAPAAAPKK